jgi:hypothetical protein
LETCVIISSCRLKECSAKGTNIRDLLDVSALELLASSLKTPLRIEEHLKLAIGADAYKWFSDLRFF